MVLTIAKPEQVKEIYGILKKYEVFSWLRYDALLRRITTNNCFLQDGIVITWGRYKVNRKTYGIQIFKGEVMLYQIANSTPGNGKALPILNQFIKEMKSPIYLNVRCSNEPAKRLYEKAGFKPVGTTIIGSLGYIVYKHDSL